MKSLQFYNNIDKSINISSIVLNPGSYDHILNFLKFWSWRESATAKVNEHFHIQLDVFKYDPFFQYQSICTIQTRAITEQKSNMTKNWCELLQKMLLTENHLEIQQRWNLSDFGITFQTTPVSTIIPVELSDKRTNGIV